MPATRVLIFQMPRLLHDLVRQLLSQFADVQVVSCQESGEALADAAARIRPDVLIGTDEDLVPDAVCSLLDRLPRVRALAVSHHGRAGVIYELCPRRRPLGELSTATLGAAVKTAAPCRELLLKQTSTRPAP